MTGKIKNLVSKPSLDYILTRDESILEEAEKKYPNYHRTEEELVEIMHEYGAILFYETFEVALKKKDKKYFNHLKKEIEEKAGDAEVDIDYLEEIMPFMKSLNIIMGLYNKHYTLDDKEVMELEFSIQTSRTKPNTIHEQVVIIPYNLRTNKPINPSSASK